MRNCVYKKGPSITVIKAKNGNIFGGYSADDYDTTSFYSYSDDTFLFSCLRGTTRSIEKLDKVSGKEAIYNHYSYGPTFVNFYFLI
jgi:hypothetical protein